MTYEKRMKVCKELEKFAELEGTEVADVCFSLISIASHVDDYTSKEFAKAFDEELLSQLKYMKENFEIVEEETVPLPPRKVTVLREKK